MRGRVPIASFHSRRLISLLGPHRRNLSPGNIGCASVDESEPGHDPCTARTLTTGTSQQLSVQASQRTAGHLGAEPQDRGSISRQDVGVVPVGQVGLVGPLADIETLLQSQEPGPVSG